MRTVPFVSRRAVPSVDGRAALPTGGRTVPSPGGRGEPAWLVGLRDARERVGDIRVMPPGGLTLEEVGYPRDRELAARATEARARRTLDSADSPGSPE